MRLAGYDVRREKKSVVLSGEKCPECGGKVWLYRRDSSVKERKCSKCRWVVWR